MSQIIRRKGLVNICVSDEGEIYEEKGVRRFLSTWNGEKGEPYSRPKKVPYKYDAGDYYVIGIGGDKIPDGRKLYEGKSFRFGECKAGEIWVFDGKRWTERGD